MRSKGRKLMCRNFSKNVNKLLNRKPNRSKAKKEYSIIPSTSPWRKIIITFLLDAVTYRPPPPFPLSPSKDNSKLNKRIQLQKFTAKQMLTHLQK